MLHGRIRPQCVDPRAAREVTCVDLDEKAVALARENGNANQVRLEVVHADAFGYARQMGVNGKTFGLVVLDPPKLIIDRDEIAPGKRKYFDLNVLAMKLVEPGGLLVTCSHAPACSIPLSFWPYWSPPLARPSETSSSYLDRAAPDHPVALGRPLEGSYLKVAWLSVGEIS